MRRFRITVAQLVTNDQLLREDDRLTNPAGRYLYAAATEEAALDQFHREIPIGCVDDFEVSIEPFVEAEVHAEV